MFPPSIKSVRISIKSSQSSLQVQIIHYSWTKHLITANPSAFQLARSDNVLPPLILLLGPFRVMMSTPAGLEEVITYADLTKEATVEDVDDDSTLEDETDEETLEDIFSGNITLNVSQIIILPDGELIRSVNSVFEHI